jgi:hypothetical protein
VAAGGVKSLLLVAAPSPADPVAELVAGSVAARPLPDVPLAGSVVPAAAVLVLGEETNAIPEELPELLCPLDNVAGVIVAVSPVVLGVVVAPVALAPVLLLSVPEVVPPLAGVGVGVAAGVAAAVAVGVVGVAVGVTAAVAVGVVGVAADAPFDPLSGTIGVPPPLMLFGPWLVRICVAAMICELNWSMPWIRGSFGFTF